MSSTPSQPEPSTPDEAAAATPAAPGPDAATSATGAPVAPAPSGSAQDAAAQDATSPAADAASPRAVDAAVEIPAEGPLSDEQIAAIAASAQPATIRRAPRYRAFFWTGALIGIALGVALGLWVSSESLVNRWIYVVVTTLGTTLVTVLLAGACAVWVDRRGAARAAKQRGTSAGA